MDHLVWKRHALPGDRLHLARNGHLRRLQADLVAVQVLHLQVRPPSDQRQPEIPNTQYSGRSQPAWKCTWCRRMLLACAMRNTVVCQSCRAANPQQERPWSSFIHPGLDILGLEAPPAVGFRMTVTQGWPSMVWATFVLPECRHCKSYPPACSSLPAKRDGRVNETGDFAAGLLVQKSRMEAAQRLSQSGVHFGRHLVCAVERNEQQNGMWVLERL